MALPIALERSLEELARLRLGDIVGIDEQDRLPAAERPEQALFGDGFRYPPHRSGFDAPEERRARVPRLGAVAPHALRLRQLRTDPAHQPTNQTPRRAPASRPAPPL